MRNDFLKVQKRKIARNLYDFGPYITFKKSAAYLLKPLFEYHCRILYRIELKGFQEMCGGRHGEYVFNWIDAGDMGAIAQIECMEEWLTGRVESLLKTGALCAIAMKGERVAAFYLASLEKGVIGKLHMVLSLGAAEAFGEQITVHKDHRRRGLATRLRCFSYHHLREKGVTSLYGHRAMDNLASEKSAKKYDLQDIAVFQYVRFLSHQRLHYTPVLQVGTRGKKGYRVSNSRVAPYENRRIWCGNTPWFTLSTAELLKKCRLSS